MSDNKSPKLVLRGDTCLRVDVDQREPCEVTGGLLMRTQRHQSTIGAFAVVVALLLGVTGLSCGSTTDAEGVEIPVRGGPRTETSYTVPHVQHYVDPVDEVDTELRRRIGLLPDIETEESSVSITGTVGLLLGPSVDPIDPAAMLRDREFAHLHPDGSFHAVLPVQRALEATEAKWAELHPWVGRADFWDGMVMLYTPQTLEELEVTWQLVVDSYNFVTGRALVASEVG